MTLKRRPDAARHHHQQPNHPQHLGKLGRITQPGVIVNKVQAED